VQRVISAAAADQAERAAVAEEAAEAEAASAAAVEAGGSHEYIQNINPGTCKGDENNASGNEH